MKPATIEGKVSRVYTSEKFGSLKFESTNGRRLCKFETKAFDKDIIACIKALKVGQDVSVEFVLDTECLRDKAGQDVMVDGYKVWSPCLKAVSINGVVKAEADPLNGDNVPF